MDLNTPATEDNIDQLTEEHIFEWATGYLPRPSADAFATWINTFIGDWEDEGATLRAVLTGAYQQWTGCEYPNP